MKLVRFEQNNPTGSNPILTTCPYDNNLNGLLGWLHPLNGLQSGTNTSQTILDQSDAFIALCTLLNVSANKDLALAEINKLIAIEDAAPQKDKQLSDAQSQITFLQQQMATLQVQHDALQKQIDDQSKTIDTQDAQIQTLDQNIKDLQTQLNKPVLAGWKLFIFKLISR
jgi:septal ring factor EnvC (AmiA/AmiB activator)